MVFGRIEPILFQQHAIVLHTRTYTMTNYPHDKKGTVAGETKTKRQAPRQSSSPLSNYFMMVLLVFACLSMVLNSMLANTHPAHDKIAAEHSTIGMKLKESVSGENPRASSSLVGLDCTRFGGPTDAQEFVYWQDIPGDSKHISPFHRKRKGHTSKDEYLTFEPDHGGE